MPEYREKILISACLLGEPVRYDGKSKQVNNSLLERWRAEGRLVVICPEVRGGLPVPRPAAEVLNANARDVLDGKGAVHTRQHDDVSRFFLAGAQHALDLCHQHRIKIAILKENSPSCGSSFIHDGGFTGKLVPGEGITTALLRQSGIKVFNENQVRDAAVELDSLRTS